MSEGYMKWAHSPHLLVVRGKFKMLCACGKQSPKLDSSDAATNWHVEHTKIREKPIGREV